MTNENSKGEYYLTDDVGTRASAGVEVGAYPIDDILQTEGPTTARNSLTLRARRTHASWTGGCEPA